MSQKSSAVSKCVAEGSAVCDRAVVKASDVKAIQANLKGTKELLQLCELISSQGLCSTDATCRRYLTFGKLLEVYYKGSMNNNIVAMLLRARKCGLLQFPGEMLFQREHESTNIYLAEKIVDIRQKINLKLTDLEQQYKAAMNEFKRTEAKLTATSSVRDKILWLERRSSSMPRSACQDTHASIKTAHQRMAETQENSEPAQVSSSWQFDECTKKWHPSTHTGQHNQRRAHSATPKRQGELPKRFLKSFISQSMQILPIMQITMSSLVAEKFTQMTSAISFRSHASASNATAPVASNRGGEIDFAGMCSKDCAEMAANDGAGIAFKNDARVTLQNDAETTYTDNNATAFTANDQATAPKRASNNDAGVTSTDADEAIDKQQILEYPDTKDIQSINGNIHITDDELAKLDLCVSKLKIAREELKPMGSAHTTDDVQEKVPIKLAEETGSDSKLSSPMFDSNMCISHVNAENNQPITDSDDFEQLENPSLNACAAANRETDEAKGKINILPIPDMIHRMAWLSVPRSPSVYSLDTLEAMATPLPPERASDEGSEDAAAYDEDVCIKHISSEEGDDTQEPEKPEAADTTTAHRYD